MNTNDIEEMARSYREFEKKMDDEMVEMDKIEATVNKREEEIGEFTLPEEFDSQLTPEDEEKMAKRCEALEEELANRGFVVHLDQHAPLKVLDLYLQHVTILTEGLEMPGNWNTNFNGCKYWCEDCFQREWCSVKEEIERED